MMYIYIYIGQAFLFYPIYFGPWWCICINIYLCIYITRYGKSCNFVMKSPPKDKKTVFLENFRLCPWCTYLRSPIVNEALQSFWQFNELSTTSGSGDVDCEQFWNFWAQICPQKLFRPSSSLFTNWTFKIDLLRIPKQLLSSILQKLDDYLTSSTALFR